ncbi:unnamed protein product [Blepharisma stoltei]|uniref:AB hydrolase-1 domain-containing protein n=1 Tax=Blepharisma stoltei TaxID=1481888 RepID=A0AAU9J408_9CILI|nr:unnamed protein product [Blepharisma stoltei]
MIREVKSYYLTTSRITHFILECESHNGIPIVFVHDILSSSRFFKELMQRMPPNYHCYAYDLRGFGRSQSLPLDATKGLDDFSEDLQSLIESLNLRRTHLVGWGLGGAVIMKYSINHSDRILSLTLESPISPYGLFGTKQEKGIPIFSDYSGSGIFPIARRIQNSIENRIDNNDHFSMRNFFKYITCFPEYYSIDEETENEYINEIFLIKIGDDFFPGNNKESENWPGWCPGDKGIFNAISGKYHNVEEIINLNEKPPILWIRGEEDAVISDKSLLDPIHMGISNIIEGYPGKDEYPYQPMIKQMKYVIDKYRERNGKAIIAILEHCGHAPHIEKDNWFLSVLMMFLSNSDHLILYN